MVANLERLVLGLNARNLKQVKHSRSLLVSKQDISLHVHLYVCVDECARVYVCECVGIIKKVILVQNTIQ